MGTKILFFLIVIIAILSCNNRRQPKLQQETPKALADKNSSYEIISKERYDDMIESLYKELVTKNIDLKQLEDKIAAVSKSKTDSIDLFIKFNQKNEAYYHSADNHTGTIKDSLLRDKMKVLIADSKTAYNTSITLHKELLEMMEAKNLTISDMHTIVKIVKTLPLIHNYQKENLPNKKSLEGFVKQQDEIIKLADTLSKK